LPTVCLCRLSFAVGKDLFTDCQPLPTALERLCRLPGSLPTAREKQSAKSPFADCLEKGSRERDWQSAKPDFPVVIYVLGQPKEESDLGVTSSVNYHQCIMPMLGLDPRIIVIYNEP